MAQLFKSEVVQIMTDTIVDMNRQMGAQQNVPSEQVQKMIDESYTQLMMVNGLLYDKLKEIGVIY